MITIKGSSDIEKRLSSRIAKGVTEHVAQTYIKKISVEKVIEADLNKKESQIEREVSTRISQIGKRQQAGYTSYLQGLERILRDPSRSYQGDFLVMVKLKTGEQRVSAKKRLRQETELLLYNPKLTPLADATIDLKEEDANLYKGMWKHTGKMHKAFQQALRKQRVMDTSRSQAKLFINKKGTPHVTYSGGKFYYEVPLELMLPGWEGAHADLMNQMIVEPFAGYKSAPISQMVAWKQLKKKGKAKLIALQQKKQGVVKELRSLEEQGRYLETVAKREEIKRLSYEYSQAVTEAFETQKSKVGATGLMRFIAPESTRPFIQQLSARVGKLVTSNIN